MISEFIRIRVQLLPIERQGFCNSKKLWVGDWSFLFGSSSSFLKWHLQLTYIFLKFKQEKLIFTLSLQTSQNILRKKLIQWFSFILQPRPMAWMQWYNKKWFITFIFKISQTVYQHRLSEPMKMYLFQHFSFKITFVISYSLSFS